MTAKVAGYVPKVLACLFTSVVAPVLVNLAVRDITDTDARANGGEQNPSEKGAASRPGDQPAAAAPTASPPPAQAPQPGRQLAAQVAPVPHTAEIIHIIVEGAGWTPAEALQDGLRTALQRALAAQVDAATWARSGQVLFEGVLHNSSGLILRCKELTTRKEWKLRGTWHRQEIAVEVNRTALRARLRAAHNFGQVGSPAAPAPATPVP